MTSEELIDIVASKIKLIRIEYGYTQDKMATILGISKKTLVQIEKQRIKPSWTTLVTVCALFRYSEILRSTIGGDPIELLETIAHKDIDRPKEKTMGGRIWWREVNKRGPFCLQQNVVSKHFRIIDKDFHRWYSSFDEEEATQRLDELVVQHP
jgi:DNA-binding XRE family transcriptional regulator